MIPIRSGLLLLAGCIAVTACAAQVQNKEDMLASAGFKAVPANTPGRQATLTRFPPHKFAHTIRNNAVVYVYADPTICDCLYFGSQAAYDRYRANVFQKHLANEQAFTTERNDMADDLDMMQWRPGTDNLI
jgi:hypothetical protein